MTQTHSRRPRLTMSQAAQRLVEDLQAAHVRIPFAVALDLAAAKAKPRAHGRLEALQKLQGAGRSS